MNRKIAALRSMMALCALMTACSNENLEAMRLRHATTVETEVEETSSRILEMLDIKGKVTESGAMTSRCSDYDSDDEVYRARHPWSVYNAPFVDMGKAMERVRKELPLNGWKIVKDGHDGTVGNSPQIIAESKGRTFAVDIRLHRASAVGDAPDLLEVTVESACFRAK